MPDNQPQASEPTAVDDVRLVRERIAREHGGDLYAHVQETTRIAEALRAVLGVKHVSPSPPPKGRASTGG